MIRPYIKYIPLKSESTGDKFMWVNSEEFAFGQGADIWISIKDYDEGKTNGCQSPFTYQFDPEEISGMDLDSNGFAEFGVIDYEIYSIQILE